MGKIAVMLRSPVEYRAHLEEALSRDAGSEWRNVTGHPLTSFGWKHENRGFAKPALYTEDLASDVRGRYP